MQKTKQPIKHGVIIKYEHTAKPRNLFLTSKLKFKEASNDAKYKQLKLD